MARTLKQFDPPQAKGGRPQIHPWDKWLNGQTWELTQGKDFTCDPHHLQKLIRKTASLRGVVISVFRTTDSKLVITPRKQRQAG